MPLVKLSTLNGNALASLQTPLVLLPLTANHERTQTQHEAARSASGRHDGPRKMRRKGEPLCWFSAGNEGKIEWEQDPLPEGYTMAQFRRIFVNRKLPFCSVIRRIVLSIGGFKKMCLPVRPPLLALL